MPLYYQPHPGTLWMCDFNTGFVAPEMVKVRPAVVISPRPQRMINLCTIVPLSTAVPNPVEQYHHPMDPRSIPAALGERASRAKCDMLYTVSLARLEYVGGRRGPGTVRVTDEDFEAIRQGIPEQSGS